MGKKVIYTPKGRAKEYGDYCVNIYTGCTHGCVYCYARKMHERYNKTPFDDVKVREGLIPALEKQLATGAYKDKLIHLCFTCDPYPIGADTNPTREVIKLIKTAGANVQILTKGGLLAVSDFDLLDGNDWFGVTVTEYMGKQREIEPNAATTVERIDSLKTAKARGIKTWVSFEPVYNPSLVYEWISYMNCIDHYKIGKLNHFKSNIDWCEFGNLAERLCQRHKRSYYIKEDLRKEMDNQ